MSLEIPYLRNQELLSINDALDEIAHPSDIGMFAVAITLDNMSPEIELEIAFADLLGTTNDKYDMPRSTFRLGSSSNSLRKAYNSKYTTKPDIFIAEIELHEDFIDASYMFPVAAPCSDLHKKAVISAVRYSSLETTTRTGLKFEKLSRKISKHPGVGKNPYYKHDIEEAGDVDETGDVDEADRQDGAVSVITGLGILRAAQKAGKLSTQ